MYEDIRGFWRDRKKDIIPFLVAMVVALACAWLVHDYYRNDSVYADTDNAMADVDKRIESIEQRIDRIQERNTVIEKTVSGTVVTIRESRENAVTVADGIGRAEERLDAIIQRQGRIENIIADIEAANRQGTQSTQTADMAK